jgi:hypothetical protein
MSSSITKYISHITSGLYHNNFVLYVICALALIICVRIWFQDFFSIENFNDPETNIKTPIPIVVIASTENQDYIDFINNYWIPLLLWLEKHRTPELNIYIYLIFGAGNSFEKVPIPEEIRKYFLIYGDIPETYTPGILQKTLKAFEDMNQIHPDYEILYRTNVSTFLLLDRIVKRINTVVGEDGKNNIYNGHTWSGLTKHNNIDINPNITYVSGLDIMLSKDIANYIVSNKEKLNYDIIDDLEIGRFLHENKNVVKGNHVRIYWDCKPEDMDMNKYLEDMVAKINDNKNFMIVRLKCSDTNGSRHNDTIVMKYLLQKYYIQ